MGALDFRLPVHESFAASRASVEFDAELSNTLWITMKNNAAEGCQNFTLPMVREMNHLIHSIDQSGGHWCHEGQLKPIHYAVMRSDHPTHFSVGGDLKHFHDCISRRDRESLYEYSKLCLDTTFDWAMSSSKGTTTIALVQGRALGGGFETALAADFLIAEEHSEFGLPEIMFGLFPCSGGMSFLARRVGVHQAERMMTSARIYTAPELKEMGVIDEICARGEGNLAVEKFIANHAKRRVPRLMLQRARHRVAPLDYSELLTVVNDWVELAMGLSNEELRVMEMLIKMQRGGQK